MAAPLRVVAALSAIAVVALVSTTTAAKVEVRSERDKTYDFRHARTWAWDPTEHGKVLMARSAEDDPAAVQRRFGPTIVEAIAAELGQRGLTAAVSEPSDVRVHYYLLVTVGFDSQTLGQFLPAMPEWDLPPFAPQTTSIDVVQRGALVVDAVSTALHRVIWRSVGRTDIHDMRNDDERRQRIRSVVHEIVKTFPKG
jgi:uncharacterized protein DUF4136